MSSANHRRAERDETAHDEDEDGVKATSSRLMMQSSTSQKRPDTAQVAAASRVSPRRPPTMMPVAIGPSSTMAKNHSSPSGLKTIALMAATPASRGRNA